MKSSKTAISREIGLEIAEICGRHFLKLQHLHYGYWTKDLEVDIGNLHTAQENYVDFLISHIPDTVQTILDVGCGTGRIAGRLLNIGYQVDCVSPSSHFAERVRTLLGNKSRVLECRYEDLNTEKRYDMILFSESFQYVGLEQVLENTLRLSGDEGYMLICDFFQKDVRRNGSIGGGHKLGRFYDIVKKYPFGLVKNLDITEQTAPSVDVLNDALQNAVQPVLHAGFRFFESRYPLTLRFLMWKYRRKINKAYEKYFNNRRTNRNFKEVKSYRLLLYRKYDSMPWQ